MMVYGPDTEPLQEYAVGQMAVNLLEWQRLQVREGTGRYMTSSRAGPITMKGAAWNDECCMLGSCHWGKPDQEFGFYVPYAGNFSDVDDRALDKNDMQRANRGNIRQVAKSHRKDMRDRAGAIMQQHDYQLPEPRQCLAFKHEPVLDA